MNDKKKELKEKYKQAAPQMGVYQIRNLSTGRIFVGAALNLPGILNSNRFQLNMGSHPNRKLQADWKEFGSESFAFEVLDELAAKEGAGHDYRADLETLENLWLEKLMPYGERGYNQEKKGR